MEAREAVTSRGVEFTELEEIQIDAGHRIAQLLLFPYIKGKATPVERTTALGNTEICVFWQMIRNSN